MSLENPMVSGYSPEREPEADYACPRCQAGLEADTPVYQLRVGEDNDKYICGECLKDSVLSMDASDIADLMFLEQSTAEDEA